MGNSFLSEVAKSLWDRFGEKISDINVVFPNKRARLFFERELSTLVDKPIWQPNYETIDNFLKTNANIELVHNLKLIALLYEVYTSVTKEEIDFDKFYSFGEIILGDFDTIDKYLINPRKIFQNIAEIGEIDDTFEVNTIESEIIESFWHNYNGAKGNHAKLFARVWQHLYEIYIEFNTKLDNLNIGYSGKIYRRAARNLQHADIDQLPIFAFVGFNALNSCEKTIFKHLQNREKAIFYWDCDRYYLNNDEQEAGLFLRRNIKLFGDGQVEPTRDFRNPKNIEIIKSPSEVLQARVLEEVLSKAEFKASETAVILTNEKLLPVVISFIPKTIEKVNITMGGMISHSVPYVLFERIIRAQKRRLENMYHLSDIEAICSHPLVKPKVEFPEIWINQQKKEGNIHVNTQDLENEQLKTIFTDKIITGETIGSYLSSCVSSFCYIEGANGFSANENNEYAEAILESIEKVVNIVNQSEIKVSTTIYLNLLKQVINGARVSYIGEPLDGMQMMGILESRCIDFKNIIMMSITDETFPSSRSGNSFIPHNLRRGFGLPTQKEHAAVWAYYFYRLIQRAQNVTLIYAATSDTMGVSEPSRYIYQLEYESGHTIKHTNVDLNVSKQSAQSAISETKDENTLQRIENMSFSPSRINDYIDCELKFFYKHIKGVKVTKQVEQIDPIDTGNILHLALEILYKPLQSNVLPALRNITNEQIQQTIDSACDEVLGKRAQQAYISNSLSAVKELIFKYIHTVLKFDIEQGILNSIVETEMELNYTLEIDNKNVKLFGKADRVDRLNDNTIRVVDYKSGRDKQEFDDIDSLFYAHKDRNKAAFQTLLYSLMSNGTAAIYNVKKMSEEHFSPLLKCKETGEIVDKNSDLVTQFKKQLTELFREIFSSEPFTQSPDINSCNYCDFNFICRRNSSEQEE